MPEQDDKNPQNEVRQDQPEVDINTENQVVSDPKTDSAVVDIEREEGDQLLEENTTTPESPKSTNRKFSLRSIFRKKKFWIPALAVVVIIAVLAIIPYTRYKIAGLVIHKN